MLLRTRLRLLKGSGVILLIAAGILFNAGRSSSVHIPVLAKMLCLLLGLLIGSLGAFLVWRGRQHAAKADAERILTDHKPDVLYLRSFRIDQSTADYAFENALTGADESALASTEEQLADVIRPIGDLVAIGRPGEGLPTPGAARIYASDDEWKELVKRQMRAAQLIIIRAGAGENLLWELKQAVETVNPQKLLILVLKMNADDYEFFRMNVWPILGVSLPRWIRQFQGFIGFGADWEPRFFPLRIPYMDFRPTFFSLFGEPFFIYRLKFALRPVFKSLGQEWQPPPHWKPTPRIIRKLVESVRTFFH
jgi:hypothetical protein